MLLCFLFQKLKKVYNWYHAQATGGGAYKFANDFREKLGVYLDKLDEMDSVVSGANFLLQVSP
jgi:pantothenate kinase